MKAINSGNYQSRSGKKANNGHQPGPVSRKGSPPSSGSKVKKTGQ
nr:hypothetical protein [Evansella caseinilytica]